MMKATFLFTAVLCSIFFTSCSKRLRKEGNGTITTTTRTINAFNGLEVEGAFTIYTHTDTHSRVEVITDENIAPEVSTYVQNGTLYIEMNDDYYHYDFSEMTLHIYGPEYSKAAMNGNVSLFVTDTLHVASLDIEHNGEGLSNVRFNGGTLHYEVNGSADATGIGNAQNIQVQLNGKSKVDFLNLFTNRANVEVNGKGNVYVHCTEQLDASINGSGHIYYLGSPQLVTQISGNGNVSPY